VIRSHSHPQPSINNRPDAQHAPPAAARIWAGLSLAVLLGTLARFAASGVHHGWFLVTAVVAVTMSAPVAELSGYET